MSIDWFRKPVADDPGTLNACFNALDRHVIRGQAETVAVELAGRKWTYADLLAEVGAFAGALRAFGVGPGVGVLVGPLPGHHEVVASLAVARLGAVRWYAEADTAAELGVRVAVLPTKTDLDLGDLPLITVDDSSELSWAIVMRAGRTDPAGCADVTAPGVLAMVDGQPVSVLAALGVSDDQKSPAPPGATLVEVGGLTLWSFDAPGESA